MKFTAWPILVLVLSAPAVGSGFIPGILQSDSSHIQLQQNTLTRLSSSSLAEPAQIDLQSPYATLEYSAENLLRTKTGGRLTADIKTWGQSESLFIPLRISNRPTTIALSHTSSNASLYYSGDDTGTDLGWNSDSGAWAINHSIGSTRVGLAGSWSSGLASGKSLYPPQAFNIFSGWTPARFRLDGRETLLQLAKPFARGTEISLRIGAGATRLNTEIGAGSALISIPAAAVTTQSEIDITKRLSSNLSGSVGCGRSVGSSSNPIYRNVQPIGTLRYAPAYNQVSASLKYQREPGTAWEAGFMSSRWDLDLHGVSINGDKLGLNIKPFSERVDFNAAARLSMNVLHLGMEHQMSKTWSWGWHYKLARVESNIDADYVGRAFFGLISASGSYDNSLLATTVHGLELSARYVHKSTSVELRLEQIVPQASGDGHSSQPSTGPTPTPSEHSSSTGGTSLSITSGYSF